MFTGLLLTLVAFTFPAEAKLDAAVAEAVTRGDCPGAVIEIGNRDGVVFTKAYGDRSQRPTTQPMTVDAVFDLASLTKSIATAMSVAALVDEGKLAFDDPIVKHLSSMNNHGKDKITVAQCLLHTAGFVPDNPMGDYANGPEAAWAKIDAIDLKSAPGEKFAYSDVGFEVLGRLVQKVTGEPLNQYAKRHVFELAGMTTATYRPTTTDGVVPTEPKAGLMRQGTVHDPRADALGGVAGHAGLFGTAADVGRFCRVLLRGGEIDGRRVLSEAVVKEMTTMRATPDGKNGRGYGLDFTSGFSTSVRGDRFTPGKTFGHTGFTGTSFWIDPEHGMYVVLLTSRLHPDGKGDIAPLRRAVATIAADAMLPPK